MLDSSDDLAGIPERSRLFHLKPMNIGKPNVESLASYTQRLIEAHSIDFDYFLQCEIYPKLGKQKKEFNYFSRESILNTGWMIEGSTYHYRLPEIGKTYFKKHKQATEKFIQLLEKLTLRSYLGRLTVMPLSQITPQSGLLRRKLAWCPDCLSQWKQDGEEIYYPLLWSIKNVVMCSEHGCFLRMACPHCEQLQELLPSEIEIGYCSICSKWLSSECESSVHYRLQEFELNKGLTWHSWVASSVGEFLALTSCSEKSATRVHVKKEVINNIQKLKLARYQLLEKTQQDIWLSLDGLLKICYDTGLSPIDLVLL